MLKIITFRDPGSAILFRPTKNIEAFDKKLKKIAQDLENTLLRNDGLGLAAPQVGQNLAICVIRTGKSVESFCNPEVTARSAEKDKMEEGCLSFPNVFLDIIRPRSITLTYQDLAGKMKKMEAAGLLARTLQHEIDHLNGV
ncbi:MAG: peptide deformylase, partial [Candidatus Moraniibacteriota bacterium]